jgi:hypothetical protein
MCGDTILVPGGTPSDTGRQPWRPPARDELLKCHRDAQALLRRNQVIQTFGILAEVDPDPVHLAAEFLLRR